MPHAAASMRSPSAPATSSAVRRFDMTTAATAAVRCLEVSDATTSAMRCLEVSATTSAARGFECPRLLLVLTLERLHFLRMLAL